MQEADSSTHVPPASFTVSDLLNHLRTMPSEALCKFCEVSFLRLAPLSRGTDRLAAESAFSYETTVQTDPTWNAVLLRKSRCRSRCGEAKGPRTAAALIAKLEPLSRTRGDARVMYRWLGDSELADVKEARAIVEFKAGGTIATPLPKKNEED
jgi:hypothetical protein